jgi:predicted metal-dependent enzyme (double-stranded beta helix superfamily)
MNAPDRFRAANARYGLARFVADLRRARAEGGDEKAMLRRVRPLALRLAAEKDCWLTPGMCRPDPEQGFGVHILHEEADHALTVFVATWLPGRGAPPHDHGTWAVVAGIEGVERNTFWRRIDDRSRPGHAELEPAGEKALGPGAAVALPAGTIHSVRNDTPLTTVSLHVYGMHVNHTVRSQFDPDRRTEAPFKLRTSGGGLAEER